MFYEETLFINYNRGNRAKTAGGGWQRMVHNIFCPADNAFRIHYHHTSKYIIS